MTSIDVGIPVFNEKDNVKALLDSVKNQTYHSCQLGKLIIYDDCSEDGTNKLIQSWVDYSGMADRIIFKSGYINKGKSYSLNQILDMASGEVLVVIDSDLELTRRDIIENMAIPHAQDSKLGLSSGLGYHNNTRNITSRVFDFAAAMNRELAKQKPLFACWGGIMAMSRKFYTNLKLPEGIYRTDAYMYLAAIRAGHKYTLNDRVLVLDQMPFVGLTFRRFAKMQKRVSNYPEQFNLDFPPELFASETLAPPKTLLKVALRTFPRHPLNGMTYISFKVAARIYSAFSATKITGQWRGF
jgi:cellulose synthase/poly-beta-1,6-N-acetylglucosamine synthase-like glycosyltransferase